MQLPYHNLRIKHWNPGAKNPLILPVHVICNTSDEALHDNIRENSADPDRIWMTMRDEHKGIAVLCGGGPSIADCLDEILQLKRQGGTIFALNGAAKYLFDNGVMPDYQVLIDARAETAQLVGPARHHLFASQVHPDSFARAPDAWLWHLQIEGIDDDLPDRDCDLMMVGGAASVGNTATCLAYAMGYRNLHCFGYDSSHRDEKGHAYLQPMNDGDPCALVDFNGKTYKTSLTMKLQAERFQETARSLQQLGCKISVHGSGLLPDIWNMPVEVLSEQEKYNRMWNNQIYREVSPGEECVDKFLSICKPDGLVIDLGCGTGRAGLKIKEYGCHVILLDFTENSRDEAARHLPFWQHDLKNPITHTAKFGYCTDVMEHIAPEDVTKVINNIMFSARTVFFQISTVPDSMGTIIGQQLHLTVKPHAWWKEKFLELGYEVSYEEEGSISTIFVVKRKGV